MTTKNLFRLVLILMPLMVMENALPAASSSLPAGLAKQQQLWNGFVDKLYHLHKKRLSDHGYYTSERIGGYGGRTNNLEYYREVHYYDRKTRQLLSIVKWEQAYPFGIHMIDVFSYDKKGRLEREYSATYLPSRHTSPSETLIILHYYKDKLHSFREFDASNIHIYEECSNMEDGSVIFAFHYEDIPDSLSELEKGEQDAYRACFSHAANTAGPYIDPLVEISAQD